MFVAQQTHESCFCFLCFNYLLLLFAFPSSKLSKNYERSSNSILLICGINAGNPEQARWAHLARLGSQSEHRIRFIVPTGAVRTVIMRFRLRYHHKFVFFRFVAFSLSSFVFVGIIFIDILPFLHDYPLFVPSA